MPEQTVLPIGPKQELSPDGAFIHGEAVDPAITEWETLDDYANYTRDVYISDLSKGIRRFDSGDPNQYDQSLDYIAGVSYEGALKFDPDLQPQDWLAKILPEKTDSFKKAQESFLATGGGQDTDIYLWEQGHGTREKTPFINALGQEDEYIEYKEPDENTPLTSLEELIKLSKTDDSEELQTRIKMEQKRHALGVAATQNSTGDLDEILPFFAYNDENGKRHLAVGDTAHLRKWPSLQAAINTALEREVIHPRDIPDIARRLGSADGKVHTDTLADISVVDRLSEVHFASQERIQAEQEANIEQARRWAGEGGTVRDFERVTKHPNPAFYAPIRSLKILLGIASLQKDKEIIKSEGTATQKFRLSKRDEDIGGLELFAGLGIGSELASVFGSEKDRPIDWWNQEHDASDPFSREVRPSDDLVEKGDISADKLTPEFILKNLRSILGEQSSDSNILNGAISFTANHMNLRGQFHHFTDPKFRHHNIRQFGDMVVATPTLMANRAFFEKALADRPDLSKSEKEQLIAYRKAWWTQTAMDYNAMLNAAPDFVADKWSEARAKAAAEGKELTEALDEFLSDEDNYNALKGGINRVTNSVTDNWNSMVWGVMAAATWGDWSKTFTQAQSKVHKEMANRKMVAKLFGQDSLVVESLELGTAVMQDIALTVVLSAATTPIGAYAATAKKLSTAGFRVSGPGALKGLQNTLIKGQESKAALATLNKGIIARKGTTREFAKLSSRQKSKSVLEVTDALKQLNTSMAGRLGRGAPLAFSVGLPATTRSGSAMYHTIFDNLPDNLSFDEKHSLARSGGLLGGLVTGGITAAFSLRGIGGAESIVQRTVSGRHTMEALRKLKIMGHARTASGKKVLARQVGTALREMTAIGLKQTIARGLTGLTFKKAPKLFFKYMLPEGVEEALDEFAQTYVQDSYLDTSMSTADRLAVATHAGLLGMIMGGTVPVTVAGARAVGRKLGLGRDESDLTETAYRDTVDRIMARAEELNEASAAAKEGGAPLTASVLDQNRRELLAGMPRRRVAPADQFRMTTDPEDTRINPNTDPNKVVTVDAQTITKTTSYTLPDGETIFRVDYAPAGASGQELSAYTSDESVTRVGARNKTTKVSKEMLTREVEARMIPDVSVEESNDILGTQDGINRAVDAFIKSNSAALRGYRIEVITDPDESTRTEVGISQETYLDNADHEVYANIDQEGNITIVVNSANVARVAASMPKKRRGSYVKNVLIEGYLGALDYASARDKWDRADKETRVSLLDYIIADRQAIYEEMSPYERDRAASIYMGVEMRQGLSDDFQNTEALVSTHIRTLMQYDLDETITEVERTLGEGRARGGRLGIKITEKLLDILDYLRAAVRTATDVFRPLIRDRISSISEKLSAYIITQLDSKSAADIDKAVDDSARELNEQVQGSLGDKGEQGAPGLSEYSHLAGIPVLELGEEGLSRFEKLWKGVGSWKNVSPEKDAQRKKEAADEAASILGLDEGSLEFVRKGVTLVFRDTRTGEYVKLDTINESFGGRAGGPGSYNTTLRDIRFIKGANPDLIHYPYAEKIIDAGNGGYVVVVRQDAALGEVADFLRSGPKVDGGILNHPDLMLFQDAMSENPLFAQRLEETDSSGKNAGMVLRDGKVFITGFDLDFANKLTSENEASIIDAKPEGVPLFRFTPETQARIIELENANRAFKGLPPVDLQVDTTLNEEDRMRSDLDVQNASVQSPEDSQAPEPPLPTTTDLENGGTETLSKSERKQQVKADRIFSKVMSRLRNYFTRMGVKVVEIPVTKEEAARGERLSAAFHDKTNNIIVVRPDILKGVVKGLSRRNATAVAILVASEEADHNFSYESLSLTEVESAINQLAGKDRQGVSPLIRMAMRYLINNQGIPNAARNTEEALSVLRLGLPKQGDLPAGVEDTPQNRVRQRVAQEYIFEELLRSHSSLIRNGSATEQDYEWLLTNPGVTKHVAKYFKKMFQIRLEARRQLREDSRLRGDFHIALARVAAEYKAAKGGYRRRPDMSLIDDLDITLGAYVSQASQIGAGITTVSEEEEREDWLSEVDPEEVKQSVIPGATVGSRSPTAKGVVGTGVDPDNQVTLEALRESPEAYKKNALLIMELPIVSAKFKGTDLSKTVTKLRKPVMTAETRAIQAALNVKDKNAEAKKAVTEYLVKQEQARLKPELRKQRDAARKEFTDLKKISDSNKSKQDTASKKLTRMNQSLKKHVTASVKATDNLIKKAEKDEDITRLEKLQQRRQEILEKAQGQSIQAQRVVKAEEDLEAKKKTYKASAESTRQAKLALGRATRALDNPKVSVKPRAAEVQKVLEQASAKVDSGAVLRAGEKGLSSKYKAVKKAKKASDRAKELSTEAVRKFGNQLKDLAASDSYSLNFADEIYAHLTEVTQTNLELLIQMFPQDLRKFASLWYDGANTIANRFAKQYGITLEQSAAVLAVFSPQKDWYMNVALAERAMHIWNARQNAKFDSSMELRFRQRSGEPELKERKDGTVYYEGNATPVENPDGSHAEDEDGMLLFDNWDSELAEEKMAVAKEILKRGLSGKKLKDIKGISFNLRGKEYKFSKEALQARFIRMHSEAASDPNLRDPEHFNIIRPDGAILERKSLSETGKVIKPGWGGYTVIEKAIRILSKKTPATGRASKEIMSVISQELGVMHKVRSFYNNIVDPSNKSGHVTMDTHAIAALLWKGLSGNSDEVSQNFGSKGTASDSFLGIRGLYPAFAEAYRSVKFIDEDTGSYYLPREIQSITWEAVRLMFPAAWKRNKENIRQLNQIWNEFRDGKMDLRAAQDKVFRYVQRSKGIPEDSIMSIDESIESAETQRGTGIGRTDWGQAAPTEMPADPVAQNTSVTWKVMDSKFMPLAKDPEANSEALYEIVKDASAKSEKRIPRVVGFEAPNGEYAEIIKNPSDAESKSLRKAGWLSDIGTPVIITPTNIYAFTRDHITHAQAARALGLKEYISGWINKRDPRLATQGSPWTTGVLVSDATTNPYDNSALTGKVLEGHFGKEGLTIDYYNEGIDGPWHETYESMSPVVYDWRGDVVAPSSRFALGKDRQHSQVGGTPDEEFNQFWDERGYIPELPIDPYDKASRELIFGDRWIISPKGMTTVRDALQAVVDARSLSREDADTPVRSPYAPLAQLILDNASDETLSKYVEPTKQARSEAGSTGMRLSTTAIERTVHVEGTPETEWRASQPGAEKIKIGGKWERLSKIDYFKRLNLTPEEALGRYSAFSEALAEGGYDSYGPIKEQLKYWLAGASQEAKEIYYDLPLSDFEVTWDHIEELFQGTDYFEYYEGRAFTRPVDVREEAKTAYQIRGVNPSSIMHEFGHVVTAAAVDKIHKQSQARYRKEGKTPPKRGKRLRKLYEEAAEDTSLPESSRFLIKTFLKAVDFGDKNLVKRDGTVPTDTSTYVSDALNAATPDRASAEHFYGLGNLDEFAAEVMSDPEFQRFLLVIPDPTPDNPKRNLWQSIVDFFQKFLKEFGIDADIKDTLLETALRSVMDVVHEEGGWWDAKHWSKFQGKMYAANEREASILKQTSTVAKNEELLRAIDDRPITQKELDEDHDIKPSDASKTQIVGTEETYANIYRDVITRLVDKGDANAWSDPVRVLDWGSGLGHGTKVIDTAIRDAGHRVDVTAIEPFYDWRKGVRPPGKRRGHPQDLIISNAVLNVVPLETRVEMLDDMYTRVKEGGMIIINTRPLSDIAGSKTAKVVGPGEIVTDKGTFQKGYTADSLKAFVETVLPDADVRINKGKDAAYKTAKGNSVAAPSVIVTKPTPAGNEVTPDVQMTQVSAEVDARYLELAEDEETNREELQRMVDAWAKAAGYNIEEIVYRGDEKPYNELMQGDEAGNLGYGLYFTPDRNYAKRFGNPRKFYLRGKIADIQSDEVYDRYEKIVEELEEFGGDPTEAFSELADELGVDGFRARGVSGIGVLSEEIVVPEGSFAKLADPVTRDTDGNVIPLSQRFDITKPSIQFTQVSGPPVASTKIKGSEKELSTRAYNIASREARFATDTIEFTDVAGARGYKPPSEIYNEIPEFSLDPGDIGYEAPTIDFHINTQVKRLLNNFPTSEITERRDPEYLETVREKGTYDDFTKQSVTQSERQEEIDKWVGDETNQGWRAVRDNFIAPNEMMHDLISDLAASLPDDVSKRDLKYGDLAVFVDPWTPLKENFKGGTKRDINDVLKDMANVLFGMDPLTIYPAKKYSGGWDYELRMNDEGIFGKGEGYTGDWMARMFGDGASAFQDLLNLMYAIDESSAAPLMGVDKDLFNAVSMRVHDVDWDQFNEWVSDSWGDMFGGGQATQISGESVKSPDEVWLELTEDPIANSQRIKEMFTAKRTDTGHTVHGWHGTPDASFEIFDTYGDHVGEGTGEFGDEFTPNVSGPDPTAFIGSHFAIGEQGRRVAGQFARGLYQGKYIEGEPKVIGAYLKMDNPIRLTAEELENLTATHWLLTDQDFHGDWWDQNMPEEFGDAFDSIKDIDTVKDALGRYMEDMAEYGSDYLIMAAKEAGSSVREWLASDAGGNHDSVIYDNTGEGGEAAILFEPEQIKSDEMVRKDKDGNTIPISKMFSDDPRYQFTQISGKPETPAQMAQEKNDAASELEAMIEAGGTTGQFTGDFPTMFKLFGSKMYDGDVGSVLLKEMSQNSFDAVKGKIEEERRIAAQEAIDSGLTETYVEGLSLKDMGSSYKPMIAVGISEYASLNPRMAAFLTGDITDLSDTSLSEAKLIKRKKENYDKNNFEDKQWFYISDNGMGMTPEIINNAFFRLAGTHKDVTNASGGYGIAKMGIFGASEEIMVDTVRDGVRSTVRVLKDDLINQKPFDIKVTEAPGVDSYTEVFLRFPKKVDESRVYLDDEVKALNIIHPTEKILISGRLGNIRLTDYSQIEGGTYDTWLRSDALTKEVNESSSHYDSLTYDSLTPAFGVEKRTFETEHANVTVFIDRIGFKDEKGKEISYANRPYIPGGSRRAQNGQYSVYSNGLLQFSNSMGQLNPMDFWGPRLPYFVMVDVSPKVGAHDSKYPFNNNREGWAPTRRIDSKGETRDDEHPIQEKLSSIFNELRVIERERLFKSEFEIIRGLGDTDPHPSQPVVYNNVDASLSKAEQELMESIATAVYNGADSYLEILKGAYDNNLMPDGGKRDPRTVLSNELKRSLVVDGTYDAETEQGGTYEKSAAYHYGAALSKNWGGVHTGKLKPFLILMNPVYTDLYFNDDGSLKVSPEEYAAVLDHLIMHEVNHIDNRTEGAGFTFSLAHWFPLLAKNPTTSRLIQENLANLIRDNAETFKSLRKKFAESSTYLLDAELEGSGSSIASPTYVSDPNEEGRRPGGERGQDTGRSDEESDRERTARADVSILEAFSGRTFRVEDAQATQVSGTPDRFISREVPPEIEALAGKKVGGLYVSADAIDGGYSVLNKDAKRRTQYEAAKKRLDAYLEEERSQGLPEFTYDVVVVEKNQVRFALMSSLTDPHPYVVQSLRVPHSPDSEIKQGFTKNQSIYHRMETILGSEHELYDYHKAITEFEESIGALGDFTGPDGRRETPSGSLEVWKKQLARAGVNYDQLVEGHERIKQKFLPAQQMTQVSGDPTLDPEFTEATEAWDDLLSLLDADIPVVRGEEPLMVRALQRIVYNKNKPPNWRKGGWLWDRFFGPLERNLQEYENARKHFMKAVGGVVEGYQNTLDALIAEYYTDRGLPVDSVTISDATGATYLGASRETLEAIDEDYREEAASIVADTDLTAEQKDEQLLSAFNAKEAAEDRASAAAVESARRKQRNALAKLKREAPKMVPHLASLRKLADGLSQKMGDMMGVTSPEFKLVIGRNLVVYLTKQYRQFTRPNWTEEFLNLDRHKTDRDIALNFFGKQWMNAKVEDLIESGLTEDEAKAQAELERDKKDPVGRTVADKALEDFLRQYEKDFGVDSFQRQGDLDIGIRKALGEFTETTNVDNLYRTIINLSSLASKMALRNKVVDMGLKAGWLITREKQVAEAERAELTGLPSPYDKYREVYSSADTAAAAELEQEFEEGKTADERQPRYTIKFDAQGRAIKPPVKRLPPADPLINYREKTEDGSVRKFGKLLAHPDVIDDIKDLLNVDSKDRSNPKGILKFASDLEKQVAKASGATLQLKTVGSIPFYFRQIMGNYLFLWQNGIDKNALLPSLGSQMSRQLAPAGFKRRSLTESIAADRGSMAYYAHLGGLGVTDEGVNFNLINELMTGRITTEEMMLEAEKLQDPDPSFKSVLFPPGSERAQWLAAAEKTLPLTLVGKGPDTPGPGAELRLAHRKGQALVLAIDNAMKIASYEYERATLVDARQDSIDAERDDVYRDLTEPELDRMAAKIILRTQQSYSQAPPIVDFFTKTPGVRLVFAPFARFMGENPRLMVNVRRQSHAEVRSSNPVIQERGLDRRSGFRFANYVLGLMIPALSAVMAGLSPEREREFREGYPKYSRQHSMYYFRDKFDTLYRMSFSYVHPMSPILDSSLRGIENIILGKPKEALKSVTLDYLFETFLNEQIMWSAVSDVLIKNEHADTGRKIMNPDSEDSLSDALNYIYEKGFEPPSLTALRRIVRAKGTDYPTDEDSKSFMGHSIYSPKGLFFRHMVPVKWTAVLQDELANRRFSELAENYAQTYSGKNILRWKERGSNAKQVAQIIRKEHAQSLNGLRKMRSAYRAFSVDLDKRELQDIMKGAGVPEAFLRPIEEGQINNDVFIRRSEAFYDSVRELVGPERAEWIRDAWFDILNESDTENLD